MGDPSFRSRFAILGSGASTATPWLQCVIGQRRCGVCSDCIERPNNSRNLRNNPSALLSLAPRGGGAPRHVMIDAGKTMRASVSRWFPLLRVRDLSAVILTHPHADAMLGLDDLRDIAPRRLLPVYLSRECLEVVRRSFAYLVPKGSVAARAEEFGYGVAHEEAPASAAPGGAAATTFVAMIEWRVFDAWVPFVIPEADGCLVVPVPVQHGVGPGNLSFAFEFGARVDFLSERALSLSAAAAAAEASVTIPPSAPLPFLVAPPQAPLADLLGPASASCDVEELACAAAYSDEEDNTETTDALPTQLSAQPGANPDAVDTHVIAQLPSLPGSRVLYISDVSALSTAARAYFRSRAVNLLIVDLLSYSRYSTHFSAAQSFNCAADIRAKVTRFVGINHCLAHDIEHARFQALGRAIAAGPLDIGLAYDGCAWSLDLPPLSLATLRANVEAVRRAAEPLEDRKDVDYAVPVLAELALEASPTRVRDAARGATQNR